MITILSGVGLLLAALAGFSLFSLKMPKGQLAMSGMTVAFDSADARHGNNEWYADCRMEDEACAARRGHELVRVSPVRVEGNLIIVRPAGEEDLTNHPSGE